jgi:hypothetical protein
MAIFKYTPLDESKREIRLLRLLCCSWKEPTDKSHGLENASFQSPKPPAAVQLQGKNLDEPSTEVSADLVACQLDIISLDKLDKRHAYTALSYTWSNQENKKKIRLNGVEFEVGINLEVALRHLRLQNENFTLWVDAICIYTFRQQDACRLSGGICRQKWRCLSQLFFRNQRMFPPFTSHVSRDILVSGLLTLFKA